MRRFASLSSLLITLFCLAHLAAAETLPLPIESGQRIALVGNSLAERMNLFGNFETRLQIRHKDRRPVVRNFARPADEVAHRQRPNNYTAIDDPLEVFGPNLFLCFFGFNESFAGTDTATLDTFTADYRSYIAEHRERFTQDGQSPRFVLISPLAFETTGNRLQPSGEVENQRLAVYTDVIRALAKEERLPFVDLFTPSSALFAQQPGAQFTINGIHLNEAGDQQLGKWLDEALFGPAEFATSGPIFDRVRAPSTTSRGITSKTIACSMAGTSTAADAHGTKRRFRASTRRFARWSPSAINTFGIWPTAVRFPSGRMTHKPAKCLFPKPCLARVTKRFAGAANPKSSCSPRRTNRLHK